MQNNPIMIFRLKNFFVSSLDEIYNFFVVMLLGNKSHYKKNAFLRPFLHVPGSPIKLIYLTNHDLTKEFKLMIFKFNL